MSEEESPAVVTIKPVIPMWRNQLVRILQFVGILAGFLGGADYLNLISLFSEETSRWLLVAGPAFSSSSKPIILFIGDIADNGQLDNSFVIPAAKIILVAVVSTTLYYGMVR